ncbi:MAG: hypothetical protein AB1Z29_03575, partial [Desulfobacterales bacterium]
MINNYCILVCDHYKKELESIVDAEPLKGITVGSFPARCGRPPIKKDELTALRKNLGEFDRTLVLGGCCIADLYNEELTDDNNFYCKKVKQCNYLIADPFMVDFYMQNGGYLLTSGWLENWKKHINEWGFEKAGAQEFVKESIREMVLLDTGVVPKSAQLLQDLSAYLQLSVKSVPVGTAYFSLFVEKIITQWQQEKYDKNEGEFQKQLAEYAMVFDMVAKSTKSVNEAEVIDHITDMVSMLFAPDIISYLPLYDGKP